MSLEKVALDLSTIINDKVYTNEPLKKYTTWRIGGLADILVLPSCIESVLNICKFALEKELPLTVIGNGSNLLIKDKGIRGITIKLTKLNKIDINGNVIKAQGGALLPALVNKALEKGLTGLEFAAGIPASVGGATVMNAGTYQGEMADYVQEVKVVNGGTLISLGSKDLNYSYRFSSLKNKDLIVVETTFQCKQESVEEAKEAIKAALEKRKLTQPLSFPNAGSVFKNPHGDSAGRLIEAAGLKGLAIGDAKISEKHANFIINLGMAKAEDVMALIKKVQNVVAEKFSVNLEPEIIVLGE